MNDTEKKQHAMTSFALFGGVFLGGKPKDQRVISRPQDFRPFDKK
ncbi:hypothetical protein [Asticcacaulis sp. YBE204]|nr:hypothetical protein [Asticcacaulis sp. YBE204]ESQ79691.1 hypothetical protein AEYBE204_07560 [Asticcacaulis sp. YBE204]